MRWRRARVWMGILAVSAVATGCASAPVTSMQRRNLTTHLVEGDFTDTYRATLAVLQDHGYAIGETDMDAGFVSAYHARRYRPGRGLRVSAVVEKRSPTRTQVRLGIVRVEPKEDRGWLVELFSRDDDGTVLDPSTFEELFRQIDLEVQRRRAVR